MTTECHYYPINHGRFEMAEFKYRNLLINIGTRIPKGCRGANFPDSCHVMTCLMGSRWCGIPSSVGTVPIGDELHVVLQSGASVDSLRADLKSALRELDELENNVDVDQSLADLDKLSGEIDAARAHIVKGQKI